MALLELEGDEDEMLLAALDAAMSRRLGLQQQQQQRYHPPPPLSHSAPQKKLTVARSSSSSSASENFKPHTPSASHHHSAGIIKKEVAQSSSHSSVYGEGRASAGVGNESRQPRFATIVGGAGCNRSSAPTGAPDLTSNLYPKAVAGAVWTGSVGRRGGGELDGCWKSGGTGAVLSGGGGGGGELKQDGFVKNGSAAAVAGWSGIRPLQELLPPWGEGCVDDRGAVERRPSSSSVWLQAERTISPPMERGAPWFPGRSGVAIFKEYQEAAMRTLLPSDYTIMHGKPFIKKSGWRKIAFFFNISFAIKDKDIQFDPQSNVLRAEFVIRASMPSGRSTESWGSCDRSEKKFSKPNHDIPSIAETRAKTRACQDLLGIGEYKSDGCN